MSARSCMPLTVRRSAAVVAAALLAGCGGGEFDTVAVRGKVLCGGTPVSGGQVTFSPVPAGGESLAGKPAFGEVGPDGTFVLTTYEDGDGAIVGRHMVRYTGPSPGDEGEEGAAPTPKFAPNACGTADPVELTVADGENELTVELTPAPKGGARSD